MDAFSVFISVVTLFAYIIPGYALGKTGLVDRKAFANGISALLLYVSSPMLSIGACMRPFDGALFGKGLLVMTIVGVLMILLFYMAKGIFFKQPIAKKRVLTYAMTFGNVGYMGVPVLQAAFGDEGVVCGVFIVMIFNILNWTLGVHAYSDDKRDMQLKKMFINAGTIGGVISLLAFILPIQYPTPLVDAVKTLGALTAPMSMILIGLILAGVKFRALFRGIEIYAMNLIKMVALPLVVGLILVLLGVDKLVIGVVTVVLAMPAATATSMFALKFNGDAEYASRTVLISVLIAAATVPLLLYLKATFFPNIF